ncbi:MAG: SDR family oxidoreductase [Pseudomonadota bacterium]
MNRLTAVLVTPLIVLFALAGCATASDSNSGTADAKGTVLVAGATGRTGVKVVESLLAQGYPVRAMVRNEAKARELLPAAVEIRVADVTDANAVAGAMAGVADVVTAIGSTSPAGPNSPEFVDYGGVVNLVTAAKAAGVDQFVLVSSLGATKVDHYLNKNFGNVLIWKLKGEDNLRASGLAYTVVRPGGLSDDAARTGKLVLDQGDTLETGRISRADVAEICVAALSSPAARNRTFEVIAEAGATDRDWDGLFTPLQPDS